MNSVDYNKIFEASLNEIYVFSADTWRFIEVNRGGRENLGYSMEALSALTPLDIKPEYTRESFQALVRPLVAGEKEQIIFETVHRRRDGTHYEVEVHLHLSSLEGEQVFVTIILDITQRKHIDEALRTSETRYRLLVENSQNAVSLHFPDGRFSYANPRYVELFGYATEMLYALTPAELAQLVHPDDLPRTRDEAHQQAMAGNRVTHLEYRARHQDGHFIWVEAFATPIFDDHGQVTQILSSLRDISERKLAHQREFEMALEKERTQLLKEFIQHAAHEFRTPLSIIRTGTYIAGRTQSPDQRQNKLRQIDEEVGRITKLIDSMLLMTKLETNGLERLEAISLPQLIEEADRRAKRHYPNRGAITVQLPPDLPTLLGDESCLTDALYELLDNAYRFSPVHGAISLTGYMNGQQLVLDVRNEGAGIAEAELPHIFDVFWRQDKAHSTPGFGLGLSIARKIIQLHGGDISAISTLGVGTTLRVTLPIAAAPDEGILTK